MEFIAIGFIVCVWMLVGSVISIPYTYLAGGNYEHFSTITIFAPAAAGILALVYMLGGLWNENNKRPRWGNRYFWILFAYFSTPIILNGISIMIKKMGYELTGYYIFELRYATLVIIPIALVFLFMIFDTIIDFVKKFSQKHTQNPI